MIFREEKIINVICKDLVSEVARKQEFDQRGCVFQKLPFPLGLIFDENNIVKLVIDNEEAAIHRCSSKYMFLKISQISQKKTCAGVSF